MQTSPTRLEKPLYIWLARILGFGIVLANIGTNLAALPETWHKIQNEGTIQDVYRDATHPDGTALVIFVSSEAAQKGIAIGDKVLNPDSDPLGEIGTPATIRIQRGNSPVREVTLVRKPHDQVVWGGMLFGLSQGTSTVLALLFLVVPMILGGIAALLICWLKSDDWMALLTGIILTNLTGLPNTNPYVVIFHVLITPLLLAWLILFPNGKLAPRWSWVLIFFLLPSTVFNSFLDLGILSYDTSYPAATLLDDVLFPLGGFGIVGVILFRYLRLFSPIERQQSKWVIFPLLVTVVVSSIVSGFYTRYWNSYQIEKGFIASFVNSAIVSVGTSLVVLGILISIFRYRPSIGMDLREALPSDP